MDYTDFDALARSYDYNPAAFLIALRRAGLTSLALTEELGANVGDNGKAYATTGAGLVNAARLAPIRDPCSRSSFGRIAYTMGPFISSCPIRPLTIATRHSWPCISSPRAFASCAPRGRG